MAQPLQVKDLGELGLLQRLRQFCPTDLIGDDAAVMDLPPGQQLVVTTDVLTQGVHFSERTTRPEDVGWRAVAANLSDLAAMGANPVGITVGLSLPGNLSVAWVDGLYRGMGACLSHHGGEIVGGDLCRAETVSVAITALGSVAPGQALYRRGAQPGQVVVATGNHGSSRAGLEVLLHPQVGSGVDTSRWIQAHRRPRPRFDVIAQLRQLLPAAADIAAMDTSDGLANALVQIAQMSAVGMSVVRSQIPIDPDLITWQGHDQALDWALYGGEDFELVLCLPESVAIPLVEQLPGAAIIGTVTDSGETVLAAAADLPAQPLTLEQGFQHF